MSAASESRPAGRIRRGVRQRLLRPLHERITRAVRLRRNAGRDFEPVFVAGVMGSGTSLTAVLLAQTFECAALVYESARGIDSRSPLWLPRTESYASVRAYREAISPGPDWTPARVRAELLTLYRQRADGPGQVVIDKGPNTNLVRAPLLARAFPSARFLLVFRDPVANVEGFRRKWSNFGRDPLDESIGFYREIHTAFLDWAASREAALEVVEYEVLVADPGATLEVLGRRLGLRPASSRRPLPDSPNRPGWGVRNVKDGRVEIVRDATRRSLEALPPEDVAAIRERLGPLHERMRKLAIRPNCGGGPGAA